MNAFAEIYLEQAKSIMAIAWRRRWLALSTACVVAAASAVAVLLIQDKYKATARIFVNTQTVLKPLMQGLTYQADVDQQMNMLARTLISRPNVERLLRRPDIRIDDAGALSHEELVTRLMGQIKVAPAGSGNLYEISYSGPAPAQSLRVVDATVSLFINAGAEAKREDSQDAGDYRPPDPGVRSQVGRGGESTEGIQASQFRDLGRFQPGPFRADVGAFRRGVEAPGGPGRCRALA
jgi:capsular polysaccharide biosynthesis protein